MRVAIVGYGVMGHHHARVCRALGHEVVIVDPHRADAEVTIDEALITADAAVIATPPMRLATEARRWFMPALVEKPGDIDPSGFHDFGPRAWIGYVERFNPVVRELQERAGSIDYVKTERLGGLPRSLVSPTLDLATHDLDILGSLGLDRTPIAWRERAGHLSALLECGTIEASHASPIKSRKITIYGTPHLHADLIEQRLWVDGAEIPVTKAEPLMAQDAAFLRGEACPVSIEEAAETLRIAEAMCETDRSDLQTQPTSLPTSLAA